MDVIDTLSLIKDYVIDNNYLYYNNDLVFDNITTNTVLPLSKIEELYAKVGDNIQISDLSKWDVSIKIGNINITNTNNVIVVDGISNDEMIAKIRKIKDYVSDINKNVIQDNFITKEGIISKYSFIPADAIHNIETLENMLNKPFKKSGDSVILEMKEEQDPNLVLNAINEYFENGSIFDIITNNGNYFIQKRNLNAAINNIVGQYRL
jgi:hypothetical protein